MWSCASRPVIPEDPFPWGGIECLFSGSPAALDVQSLTMNTPAPGNACGFASEDEQQDTDQFKPLKRIRSDDSFEHSFDGTRTSTRRQSKASLSSNSSSSSEGDPQLRSLTSSPCNWAIPDENCLTPPSRQSSTVEQVCPDAPRKLRRLSTSSSRETQLRKLFQPLNLSKVRFRSCIVSMRDIHFFHSLSPFTHS